MLECVVTSPMTLNHYVTGCGVSREMEEPKGAARLFGPNKERFVNSRAG